MIVLIILHSIPHVYKKILNAPAEPIVLPSRDTSHTLVQILLLHRRQHCREGKKASMRSISPVCRSSFFEQIFLHRNQ